MTLPSLPNNNVIFIIYCPLKWCSVVFVIVELLRLSYSLYTFYDTFIYLFYKNKNVYFTTYVQPIYTYFIVCSVCAAVPCTYV